MQLRAFAHHLFLSLRFARQELKERYGGMSFGHLWLLLSPLITIFIYTIIFSDFMQMKLGLVHKKYSYSIYLIPGLLSWNFFLATVTRLSTAILDKSHILKKIAIPMYVYYLSILLSEGLIYAISMSLGLLFLLLVGFPLSWAFAALPLLMALLALFALGLGVSISLFVPFFRDLREVIAVVLQLWFWITPIIYVKEMIAQSYPLLLSANPLYYFIEPMQNLFLYAKIAPLSDLTIAALITIVTMLVALWLYKKLIPAIKDII